MTYSTWYYVFSSAYIYVCTSDTNSTIEPTAECV